MTLLALVFMVTGMALLDAQLSPAIILVVVLALVALFIDLGRSGDE